MKLMNLDEDDWRLSKMGLSRILVPLSNSTIVVNFKAAEEKWSDYFQMKMVQEEEEVQEIERKYGRNYMRLNYHYVSFNLYSAYLNERNCFILVQIALE